MAMAAGVDFADIWTGLGEIVSALTPPCKLQAHDGTDDLAAGLFATLAIQRRKGVVDRDWPARKPGQEIVVSMDHLPDASLVTEC
jgi:hypothetical protein